MHHTVVVAEVSKGAVTMSKSRIQILIAVGLSLVLLLGVVGIAQGAALNAGAKYGQYHVNVGLQADLSRPRSVAQTTAELTSYHQSDMGGCERDKHSSPDD
jgi:hypothetical protein